MEKECLELMRPYVDTCNLETQTEEKDAKTEEKKAQVEKEKSEVYDQDAVESAEEPQSPVDRLERYWVIINP
jgi:hypothetical protein